MPGRQQIPQEVPEKSAGMLLIELYASLAEIGLRYIYMEPPQKAGQKIGAIGGPGKPPDTLPG